MVASPPDSGTAHPIEAQTVDAQTVDTVATPLPATPDSPSPTADLVYDPEAIAAYGWLSVAMRASLVKP